MFNISSGVGTSLNELIELIERVLKFEVVRHYSPSRPFDVPVSVLDNSLAQQELKWEQNVTLEEGIVKTAEWIRKGLKK